MLYPPISSRGFKGRWFPICTIFWGKTIFWYFPRFCKRNHVASCSLCILHDFSCWNGFLCSRYFHKKLTVYCPQELVSLLVYMDSVSSFFWIAIPCLAGSHHSTIFSYYHTWSIILNILCIPNTCRHSHYSFQGYHGFYVFSLLSRACVYSWAYAYSLILPSHQGLGISCPCSLTHDFPSSTQFHESSVVFIHVSPVLSIPFD